MNSDEIDSVEFYQNQLDVFQMELMEDQKKQEIVQAGEAGEGEENKEREEDGQESDVNNLGDLNRQSQVENYRSAIADEFLKVASNINIQQYQMRIENTILH